MSFASSEIDTSTCDDSDQGVSDMAETEEGVSEAGLPTGLLSRLGRLAGLSTRGGARALARQLSLGASDEADAELIQSTVQALAELRGLPMKLGQLLSYAPVELPEQMQQALLQLRTQAPPVPFADIRHVVQQELGVRGNELLASMNPQPKVVGAVGQIHEAELKNGTRVDVKVQFPGIAVAIVRDLGPAALGARVSSWFNREAQRRELVRELREALLKECDFRQEARQQGEMARRFAEHPDVVIPACHRSYCSRRVLTTDRVEGLYLEQFLEGSPSQQARDRAGAALFDFYFGSLFRFGVYNGDACPGNYLFDADGRVTIVDHACTRRVQAATVRRLAALTLAVDVDSRESVEEVLLEFGIVQRGQRYDPAYVRRVLRWFYGPMVVDRDAAFAADKRFPLSELSAHRAQARSLPVPAEWLFLARMRVGLVAALAPLGARLNWRERQRALVSGVTSARLVYEVVLVEADPRNVGILREVRAALGGGVRDARRALEHLPLVLSSAVPRAAAETLRARLHGLGGRVEVKRCQTAGVMTPQRSAGEGAP